MKINDILMEDDSELSIDEAAKIIVQQPFFKNNKPNILAGVNLYHGSTNLNDSIIRKSLIDREHPSDTQKPIHDIINKLSMEKFGINVRNKIFTHIDHKVASRYGRIYVMFPLGEYDLYNNANVKDLYIDSGVIIQKYMDDYLDIILKNIIDKIYQYKDEIYNQFVSALNIEDNDEKKILKNIIDERFNVIDPDDSNIRKFRTRMNLMNFLEDNEIDKQKEINKVVRNIWPRETKIIDEFLEQVDTSYNYDKEEVDTVLYRTYRKVVIEVAEETDISDLIHERLVKAFKEKYIDSLEALKQYTDSFEEEIMVDANEAIFIDVNFEEDFIKKLKELSNED